MTSKKLADQIKMKEVRENKIFFTTEQYMNHSFVGNSDDKEKVISYLSEIKNKLFNLHKSESILNKKTLEFGRAAHNLIVKLNKIKKSLKNGHVDIKNYLKLHLNEEPNRIYEAAAAYKAVKEGAPMESNLTVLKTIGAALASKDEYKKKTVKRWIQEGSIPNSKELSEISIKDFRRAIKQISNHTEDTISQNCNQLLGQTKAIKTSLRNLIKMIETNKENDLEQIYILRADLEELSKIIDKFTLTILPSKSQFGPDSGLEL